MLVVGDKEKEAETVAVRTRGGEDLGVDAARCLRWSASQNEVARQSLIERDSQRWRHGSIF